MKIAVFYHAKLNGTDFGIDNRFSLELFARHMEMARASGLMDAASEFVIGLNDYDEVVARARPLAPMSCRVITHGNHARSELPTLSYLQRWLPGHEDYYVCYYHAKGVTHPRNYLCEVWRQCMEYPVIRRWRRCVRDLDQGFESVGAHWLTREEYGPQVNTFFWGGNFWWAKASFLRELPELPSDSTSRDMDFLAELWIGQGRRPKVRDYSPHWPGENRCALTQPCYFIG